MTPHTSSPLVISNTSNGVPLTFEQQRLLLIDMSGGWPKVVAGELVVPDGDRPVPLTSHTGLFSWIGERYPVKWAGGEPAKKEFYESLRQFGDRYEYATPYPHYPPLPGVLYLREPPAPAATGWLDKLVGRFCPATAVDRELLKAAFVTPAVGLPPGKRPAFVVTSGVDCRPDPQRGRGTGKTSFVQAVGDLYGGTFPLRSAGDPDHVLSDLLSPRAFELRVVELDNLKSHRLSSEFLEALVTRQTIGGHLLYRGHATRPNHLTLFVTVNGPSFSKDLAQRSVVIRLARPVYRAGWAAETERLIRDHRDAIFADIGAFMAPKSRVPGEQFRWEDWACEVVGRLKEPDGVLRAILVRQGAVDADDDAADDVVDLFGRKIRERMKGSNTACLRVFIPSLVAGQWAAELDRRQSHGQATAYLKALDHPRLRYCRSATARGFIWSGMAAPPGERPIRLP